jgi:hypothetical protein
MYIGSVHGASQLIPPLPTTPGSSILLSPYLRCPAIFLPCGEDGDKCHRLPDESHLVI